MEIDSCRNVRSILILIFQTAFHAGQMDEIQHLAPVNVMLLLNHFRGILDCFFNELHLLDPILNEL